MVDGVLSSKLRRATSFGQSIRERGWLMPTTRVGAEGAVVVTMVGWRLGTLAQLLPAVPDALSRSLRPGLNAALIALVLTESVLLLGWVIRKRGYSSFRWAVADGAMAVLCLALQPWYVPREDLVGTWVGWAPGIAVNVVAGAALGCPRPSQTYAITGVITATYLIVSWPAIGHGSSQATVLSNAITFVVFAVVSRAMSGFVRRFGADADEARRVAVEATQARERETTRALLHDPASLLRFLADPDLDPEVARATRAQAIAAANRIAAHLASEGEPIESALDVERETVDLTALLRETGSGFTDLPIEYVVDLAHGVHISTDAAQALGNAVSTVLHNVRRHAGPVHSVVIHADYRPSNRRWEVAVRDDGVGFDPDSVTLGYGLRHLVGTALDAKGIASTVESEPGSGTAITMSGPVAHVG